MRESINRQKQTGAVAPDESTGSSRTDSSGMCTA